jgi:CheY-like chemotaxis protein
LSALLFSTDLLLQSQLSAAAARAAVPLQIASSQNALVDKLSSSLRLVILDLKNCGDEIEALVARIRSGLPEGAKILALGPHVHKQLLAEAEQAGCDRVLSRGVFHSQMTELLRELAS